MIKYFFLYFKYNCLLCTCTSSTFLGSTFTSTWVAFFRYLYFYSSTKTVYLCQHWLGLNDRHLTILRWFGHVQRRDKDEATWNIHVLQKAISRQTKAEMARSGGKETRWRLRWQKAENTGMSWKVRKKSMRNTRQSLVPLKVISTAAALHTTCQVPINTISVVNNLPWWPFAFQPLIYLKPTVR